MYRVTHSKDAKHACARFAVCTSQTARTQSFDRRANGQADGTGADHVVVAVIEEVGCVARDQRYRPGDLGGGVEEGGRREREGRREEKGRKGKERERGKARKEGSKEGKKERKKEGKVRRKRVPSMHRETSKHT
jgi:hypothetical protein